MKKVTLSDEDTFVWSKKTGANLKFRRNDDGLVVVTFQDLEVTVEPLCDGDASYAIHTKSEVS